MAKRKDKPIRISEELHKKLEALKHPRQSFEGVLMEMLEKLNK